MRTSPRLSVLLLALLAFLPGVLTSVPAFASEPALPTVDAAEMDAQYATLSEESKANAKAIAQAFMENGFSKEATAGVLGNAWRESHFNPNAENSIGACSIFQFLGGRRDSLLTAVGASSCSGLDAKKVGEFAATEPSNLALLANPMNNHGGYSSAFDAESVQGISGAAYPSADDSFGSLENFKSTKNWYFATIIWGANWERGGNSEMKFKQTALWSATSLKYFTDGSVTSGSDAAQSKGNAGSAGGVKTEWDLIGMPSKVTLPDGTPITVGDASKLSASERANVGEFKDSIQKDISDKSYTTASTAISALGITLFIYAFIVLLAFIADYITPGTNGFFTKAVTFGTTGYSPEAENNNVKNILFISFGLAAVGALIFTGTLSGAVLHLLRFFGL